MFGIYDHSVLFSFISVTTLTIATIVTSIRIISYPVITFSLDFVDFCVALRKRKNGFNNLMPLCKSLNHITSSVGHVRSDKIHLHAVVLSIPTYRICSSFLMSIWKCLSTSLIQNMIFEGACIVINFRDIFKGNDKWR